MPRKASRLLGRRRATWTGSQQQISCKVQLWNMVMSFPVSVCRYMWHNKPSKVLSPEYLWQDFKPRNPEIRTVRFSGVIKNYNDIRPNWAGPGRKYWALSRQEFLLPWYTWYLSSEKLPVWPDRFSNGLQILSHEYIFWVCAILTHWINSIVSLVDLQVCLKELKRTQSSKFCN